MPVSLPWYDLAVEDRANSSFRRGGAASLLAAAASICFAAPAPGGTLHVLVVEKGAPGAKPLPSRVHLRGPDGKPVRPPGLPFFHDHFSFDGEASFEAAPGRHRYQVER